MSFTLADSPTNKCERNSHHGKLVRLSFRVLKEINQQTLVILKKKKKNVSCTESRSKEKKQGERSPTEDMKYDR